MIIQTVKNILSFIGSSAICALSLTILSLVTNILVFMDYDIRYLLNTILALCITLLLSYLLGQSSGVNLTSDGKFKLKQILISNGIALAIYLLFSLSVKGKLVGDIYGLEAWIFGLGIFPGNLFKDAFYGICVALPLTAAARVLGLLSGNKIILKSRPSITEATEFSGNGSFVDPDTNKKTWRDSVK